MFDQVQMAPPDPILGLTEAFNQDPNPHKINLGVGIYKDAAGKTPVLGSVKAAEQVLLTTEATKNYKPIEGDPAYARSVQELMLGANHALLKANRVRTAHTPGGTGALRVAADYLHRLHPGATVWMSDPTWANHPNVFQAAGLKVATYPYFDAASNSLKLDAMLDTLGKAPAGDVVLLHGCCHNPTGVDPTAAQWKAIATTLGQRGLLPLVDFAYQGFGDGLTEDAAGLLTLAGILPELLVCSSFSKNFGLYNERVGAVSVIAKTPAAGDCVLSHLKAAIRANYSNPPAHGAGVVATILADEALRKQWQGEVTAMRQRINGMRQLFVATLKAKGAQGDYSFITRQRGMFSFSGLNKQQVQTLREKHAVYIVGSGRISVAGMTETNMPRLCEAIVSVL